MAASPAAPVRLSDLLSDPSRVDALSPDQLDALPLGAIQLDADGKVLKFNQYESTLSNLSKDRVVGRNFFRDVAPCTDVQDFHGRFKEGVARKQMHVKFRYHFAFKQNPRDVTVTLFYSTQSGSIWVFVQPQEG